MCRSRKVVVTEFRVLSPGTFRYELPQSWVAPVEVYLECVIFLEANRREHCQVNQKWKSFVISRKPEKTKGSVFSGRKKMDVRHSSAYLWQGLKEGDAGQSLARSLDSWTYAGLKRHGVPPWRHCRLHISKTSFCHQ